MPMIGVCILCKVLETTKHKKTASFNQTVTAVTSTHQLHVWKVIQPNDFTMGKLPSTILITLYLSTSREQKSSRKKRHSFLFYLMDRKKKDFFLWAVAFFFSFFIRLAQITPARICKEH